MTRPTYRALIQLATLLPCLPIIAAVVCVGVGLSEMLGPY